MGRVDQRVRPRVPDLFQDAGKTVLIGNQRLLVEAGIDASALAGEAERLSIRGCTGGYCQLDLPSARASVRPPGPALPRVLVWGLGPDLEQVSALASGHACQHAPAGCGDPACGQRRPRERRLQT